MGGGGGGGEESGEGVGREEGGREGGGGPGIPELCRFYRHLRELTRGSDVISSAETQCGFRWWLQVVSRREHRTPETSVVSYSPQQSPVERPS